MSIRKIQKLYSYWQTGQIPRLKKHVVKPRLSKGSRENYLYFTLPVCINFQRSSPAMWASALKTFTDKDTRYLFYPEKLMKRRRSKIQKDLGKHKLALQRNKHTDIWISISETLNKHYSNNPFNILKADNFDVVKILETVQNKKKRLFPYLGGIKLSNYWLFILSRFTEVKFPNTHEISIIPDTHVIKSSVKLGLVYPNAKPKDVENAWKKVLKNSHIAPTQMHSVLWHWSRAVFHPKV